MHPDLAKQRSFKDPLDRLLRFHGTLSTKMCKLVSKNVDSKGDPTIMVFKLGCSSELTIRCLYNICSVLRKAFKAKAGVYSREVAVLPCTSKSGAFSSPGEAEFSC